MFHCTDCIGCYRLASSIVKIMIQYNLKKKVKEKHKANPELMRKIKKITQKAQPIVYGIFRLVILLAISYIIILPGFATKQAAQFLSQNQLH